MAHTRASPGSKNTLTSYILDNEPIVVDDEFCKNNRKNFKKHSKNLDALIKDFQK